MNNVEITLRAKTVDLAVEAAMIELGIDDPEQLAVEILTEPQKGFLGIGGQDAVVRVTRQKSRRRRGDRRRGGKNRKQSGSRQQRQPKPAKNDRDREKGRSKDKDRKVSRQGNSQATKNDDRPVVSHEEQAQIAADFLEGLVDAYGLEGTVETAVEDDVIIANVNGEQTEALVGVRGSVRAAIHELTRTVLQRYSQDTARLRLDIAGYAERRRQALTIYADQLIDQLIAEGGEIMLEPMSSADRKVIHDAASARDGVESYSEGESPRRYVVLAATGVNEETGEEE